MYTEQVRHWPPQLPCASTSPYRCIAELSVYMYSTNDYSIEHAQYMSCLFTSTHTLLVYTLQSTHYNLLCVFFSYDQIPLSKDRTGDPWATRVELSFGFAWFYLARCCLSPLAMQPIMSNSNVLLWGLCISSPKSFCDRDDYYREKGHVCCFSLWLP